MAATCHSKCGLSIYIEKRDATFSGTAAVQFQEYAAHCTWLTRLRCRMPASLTNLKAGCWRDVFGLVQLIGGVDGDEAGWVVVNNAIAP